MAPYVFRISGAEYTLKYWRAFQYQSLDDLEAVLDCCWSSCSILAWIASVSNQSRLLKNKQN